MVDIVVGCDTNTGNDSQAINTVASGLKQAGFNVVEQLSVGPGPFSQYGYTAEAKGKVGIYLMAASLFSFADGTKDLYDKDIFIIRGDASQLVTSQEAFETSVIPRDSDCNSVCDEWTGMTYPQMNQKAQGKCIAVYGGKTGEEMLQAAINALNGQGIVSGGPTSGTGDVGGTAIQIKDKTFYGLIKQMIGAIDGVFTIANNMAYLLTFKDLYKYQELYEEYIPEIKESDILIEGVRHDWTTEGLYNAVEVTYADGIIKYQHDVLIELYGENTFYYEFPEDDEETAKSKARALLSAHIRDYSLDIQIDCLYNPNITVGGWVKIPKTLTNVTTTQMKGPIKKLYKAQEKKMRKGVTISNINEISNEGKTIQQVTTEDGEQYDITIEKKDYEIYFVQGYRMRWTPKQAPIMHLTLKYGPDTPEDPVNATIGIGGIQSTTGSAGGFGDDCFYVCEIMPNNNAYINDAHVLAPGDLEKPEFAPQEQHTRPRCKQGSNLAKDVAGKTPEEVYVHIRSKFGYCLYADSSALWPCVSDMYDQACGANCGDTTRLLKCAFDAIGVKSWGVHIAGHYFNALELNGKWVVVDGTGSYDYSNTAGFPIPSKPANCCEPNQQAQANTC